MDLGLAWFVGRLPLRLAVHTIPPEPEVCRLTRIALVGSS